MQVGVRGSETFRTDQEKEFKNIFDLILEMGWTEDFSAPPL